MAYSCGAGPCDLGDAAENVEIHSGNPLDDVAQSRQAAAVGVAAAHRQGVTHKPDRAELTRALFQHCPVGVIGAAIVAVMLAATLHGPSAYAAERAYQWSAMVSVCAVAHLILCFKYRQHAPADARLASMELGVYGNRDGRRCDMVFRRDSVSCRRQRLPGAGRVARLGGYHLRSDRRVRRIPADLPCLHHTSDDPAYRVSARSPLPVQRHRSRADPDLHGHSTHHRVRHAAADRRGTSTALREFRACHRYARAKRARRPS